MVSVEQNDLDYICQLVNETFKIPVIITDTNGYILREHSKTSLFNPIYSSKQERLRVILKYEISSSLPIINVTSYLESFISLKIKDDTSIIKTMYIGPCIRSSLSKERLIGVINDNSLKVDQEELYKYYASLTIIGKMELIHMARSVYYMVYRRRVDTVDIYENDDATDIELLKVDNPDLELSINRENELLHHDLYYEMEILQCIKEGNKEKVINKLTDEIPKGKFGLLSKHSYLRDEKNLTITMITLATRAVIEGGLNAELAYTLSDLYIQSVEEINDPRKVATFRVETMADFAERVSKSKQKKYSKTINTVLSYIFNHLYEKITLVHLAQLTNTSAAYLSTFFKKEVGISLSKYIQYERIEESKKLLKLTDYSLTKISTLLQFTDQSYFTKIFKKLAGVTPKQFRNEA